MSGDEQAIRDVQTAWMEASIQGDLARLSTLMADDIMFLVPGRPPFGRDEFMTGFAAGMQQFRIAGGAEFEEVIVVGEAAYCRGKLAITMTPIASGEPTRLAGYTLSVFRKLSDGRWVLARDANFVEPVKK